MLTRRFVRRSRVGAARGPWRSTGSLRFTMNVDPRVTTRAVAAAALALVVAGCGGSADESAVTKPSSTASSAAEGTELAGVQFDIRRDPG